MAATVVNDLSCSPSEGRKSWDAAQVASTGPRSWKASTRKGMSEALWPPALDGALIEALEEYRKMEAPPTTTENAVRYPMRDRFIADYILEKVGKTRTARQVASRLQQLRDACKDARSSSIVTTGSQGLECKAETPSDLSFSSRQRFNSETHPLEESMAIYVQLECPSQGAPTSTPQVYLNPNEIVGPHDLYVMPLSRRPSGALPPAYQSPWSSLSSFSNFVELVSPSPLSEETTWTVYRDNALVHQERTVLRMTSPLPTAAGQHVYICDLVPSLWPVLCESEDLNRITIVQKVFGAVESSLLATAVPFASPVREASVIYHFNVRGYAKPKSQPPSHTVDAGNPSDTALSLSSSSQAHHPSPSSWQWSSNRQGRYASRDAGHSEHRQRHEQSSTTTSDVDTHESISLADVSVPDHEPGEGNVPPAIEAPSIFARCARIVLNRCKFTSGAHPLTSHPPTCHHPAGLGWQSAVTAAVVATIACLVLWGPPSTFLYCRGSSHAVEETILYIRRTRA